MGAVIKGVMPGSPAARTNIKPGDRLVKINGFEISDVLDYKYRSYDAKLMLELESAGGKSRLKLVRLRKREGGDIGLEFETFLMDSARSCANKCVFCFIDQLPHGMRDTLYYKDDDTRLSFLQGNYVTLTNLSRRDIQRMIDLRISPINVSVHTTNPELRAFMLGNKRGGEGVAVLREFADAGIMMNCQIVCCPGINDGEELARSMRDLAGMYPSVNSVSIVPVGLTKHREGLHQLSPFDTQGAGETIRQVEAFGDECLEKLGARMFFCADELYIKAGLALPEHEHYEEYAQLENGVGMVRLFITEFEDALRMRGGAEISGAPFSVATGLAAHKYLINLLCTLSEKYGTIVSGVYGVKNEFFGDNVDVSGLITGQDFHKALKGKDLGSRLLIPENALRRGEFVFLDDMTVQELSDSLKTPIRIVRQDGADFLAAAMGD